MSLKMSLGCISPAEDGPWCPLNMVWKSLLSKLKLKHITVQELFAALRCNSKKKRKEEKAGCIVFVATQKCPFSFYKPKPRERFVGEFLGNRLTHSEDEFFKTHRTNSQKSGCQAIKKKKKKWTSQKQDGMLWARFSPQDFILENNCWEIWNRSDEQKI